MSAGDSDTEGKNNVRQGLVRNPPDLKFSVIEAGESYFRVVTNEKSMEAYVIKKNANSVYYTEVKLLDANNSGTKYNSNWYLYETWERYLKRAEYITKNNLTIYNTPAGKAIFENKSGDFLAFVVTELNGEWIKINERDGQSEHLRINKNLAGWTQWREGDKILIDVIEKTYD
jgi:hypothetical protein